MIIDFFYGFLLVLVLFVFFAENPSKMNIFFSYPNFVFRVGLPLRFEFFLEFLFIPLLLLLLFFFGIQIDKKKQTTIRTFFNMTKIFGTITNKKKNEWYLSIRRKEKKIIIDLLIDCNVWLVWLFFSFFSTPHTTYTNTTRIGFTHPLLTWK